MGKSVDYPVYPVYSVWCVSGDRAGRPRSLAWARTHTREPEPEPEQAQVGRHHLPVLPGQILGVEVKDRQSSVGKLFEVGVLHG